MAKFKKAILHAGRTYHSPDGEVKVTTERLNNWAQNFDKITAKGWGVPVSWDHANDVAGASPVKLSKGKLPTAANAVGKLASFKVAPDGSHAEILLDITDPIAKGRCERNEVCVSPIIFDKWGGKGEFSDVLTHVDLVTWPVDNSQKPFVPVEPGTIACGIRMGLTRMAFPDDDEADKDTVEEGKPGDTDPVASEVAPEKNPDSPPKKATDETKTAAFIEGMARKNVVLPSDFSFDGDGFIDILVGCINSSLAAEQAAAAKPKEEAEEDPNDGEDVMQVQDPAFASMSLATHKFAENQYRGGITARMTKLLESGRCTPAEATAKDGEVKAVKLSLGNDGEPAKSDLEKWIESREAIPAGTFWSDEVKTQRMSLQSHEPPTGDATPEQEAEIVNWALGRKKAK